MHQQGPEDSISWISDLSESIQRTAKNVGVAVGRLAAVTLVPLTKVFQEF